MLYDHFICFHEISRTNCSLFTAVSDLLYTTGVNTRHCSGNIYWP